MLILYQSAILNIMKSRKIMWDILLMIGIINTSNAKNDEAIQARKLVC